MPQPQLTEPPSPIEVAVMALAEPQLLSRLAELKEKGPIGLNIHELEELCAIYNRLRRGTSGPPRRATTRTKKRQRITLPEDLSDLNFD